MPIPQSSKLIRFGAFELDLRAREVRKDGRAMGLPDQSITVLAMLLDLPGEVVLREEIRTKLWPNDTVVEFDHSINTAMGRLRQALGDSAENPQYIETLPRRGYRWIGPVVSIEVREPMQQGLPAEGGSKAPRISEGNLIGKKVSHYRVLEVLGGGGMGVVYRGEDLKLGRKVALKFLPEEMVADAGARQRFESEARAASALNHPNICTIYGVEEYQGQPFLAMELLQGQTLRDLIADQPKGKSSLEIAKLLDLAMQITAGLEAAHRQGIIHRDIKPANIFITVQGQAKILDFGLAKFTHTSQGDVELPSGETRKNADPSEPRKEPESLAASSPFVSRTGVAMGTAGYMSPEQIRGEKLDERTDLFSLGLVLYEMATGKRAFAGSTGPELQQAILTMTPGRAQELNPELPAKLDEIIERALEKNREARYQAASAMHADLESLRLEAAQPGHRARWPKMAAAAGVLLVLSAGAYRFDTRQPSLSAGPSQIRFRQLTSVSSENGPAGGTISPDGKYLAYSDRLGMHLQLVKTGDTQSIRPPEDVNSRALDFTVGAWLPDSKSFVANAFPVGGDTSFRTSHYNSIWVVSIAGGPPYKIRDGASGGSVSPDGSLLSFETNTGKNGDREIWVMRPDGQQARKVFEVGEEDSIGGLTWSPDGERVIYARQDGPNEADSYLVGGDLNSGPLTKIPFPADPRKMRDFVWMPDGRMIYSLNERDETGSKVLTCNLWQVHLDHRTGEIIDKPQRLTNFAELCVNPGGATSNGKQLGVFEWRPHSSVYVSDLQAGGERASTPVRLTREESWNHPLAWTSDSSTILFSSSRTGTDVIFKQMLGQDTAEPLLALAKSDGLVGACLSPDGSWVYYMASSYDEGPVVSTKIMRDPVTEVFPVAAGKIMRVPITGGDPQLVFTANIEEWPRCARAPASMCAIAERTPDRKQLVFNAFDGEKGRGREIARISSDATPDYHWDLSPDGTRIALLKHRDTRVQILPLNGGATRHIASTESKALSSVIWTADGKGLFVSSYTGRGAQMLHMDFQGRTQLLWEQPGGIEIYGVPSPDGQHLAMRGWNVEGNIWLMENF